MDNKFSDNLKRIRTSKGKSQREVALAIGITPTTFSYYESGKREPSLDTFIKLAEALEVSTDELLGTDLQEKYRMDSDVVALLQYVARTPSLRTLVEDAKNLNDEQRESLHAMVNTFLKDRE